MVFSRSDRTVSLRIPLVQNAQVVTQVVTLKRDFLAGRAYVPLSALKSVPGSAARYLPGTRQYTLTVGARTLLALPLDLPRVLAPTRRAEFPDVVTKR